MWRGAVLTGVLLALHIDALWRRHRRKSVDGGCGSMSDRAELVDGVVWALGWFVWVGESCSGEVAVIPRRQAL